MISDSGLVKQTRQISAREFAEMTGIHVALQRDWRRRGLLPALGPKGYGIEDVVYAALLKAISDAGLSPKEHRHSARMAVASACYLLFVVSICACSYEASRERERVKSLSKILLYYSREKQISQAIDSLESHYLAIRHIRDRNPLENDATAELDAAERTTLFNTLDDLGHWMETGSRDPNFDLALTPAVAVTLIDLFAIMDRIERASDERGPLLHVLHVREETE